MILGSDTSRQRLLQPGEDVAQVLNDYFPGEQSVEEALVIKVLARSSPGAWVGESEAVHDERQGEALSPAGSSRSQDMHGRPIPPSRHDSAWSAYSKRYPGSAAASPRESTRLPSPREVVPSHEPRPGSQRRSSMQRSVEPTIQEIPTDTVRDTPTHKALANTSTMPPINVLLVDDNSISLNVLAKRMRGLRINYETATDGQIAVQKWQTTHFHLVLMDLRMPLVGGIEATREIRRLEREPGGADSSSRPPVIIVALTASSLPADRDEALAAGCNDFLTKPVDLPWLDRKVQEWGCMQALIDFQGWRAVKGYSQQVEG